jgi:hypothetical protein
MEVVLADLVEELSAADSEPFGGPGAVTLASPEGALDRPALDVGQQGAERDGLGGVARRRDRRIRRLADVEVLGQDRPAASEDHGPRQGVLQLPDVARPASLLDRAECLGREREQAPAVPPLDAPEDMLGQRRDILGPVAERGDHDAGDVQAIVNGLVKPTRGDLPGQVALVNLSSSSAQARSSG